MGWLAVAWIEHLCVHGPGDVQGDPVVHGDEYTGFIVDCYALDEHGRRLYDSAFLSRPKGCDKSGMAARLSLFEAFGPCRFDGWAVGGETYRDPWSLGFTYMYEPGEPMGRPIRAPFVRIMATEEDQTGNTYDSIHYNLTEGPLAGALDRRDDAGLSRVLLPRHSGPCGGEIVPSPASAAAKDGGRETFAPFDETHLYVRPELRRMYATVGRNLEKRKKIAGTWFLETTTMYAPGEDSVAEATYKLAQLIAEGKTRRARLLLDHRWGDIDPEGEDFADENVLRAALLDAYGDAAAWNDIDGKINAILDPRNDIADSLRFAFNTQHSAVNAWISGPEWDRCSSDRKDPPPSPVAPGDVITLGFDGSRTRARGTTDATALVGCRVSDGLVFLVDAWEQPRGAAGRNWQVPADQVDAAVRAAFDQYSVVGMFADPAKWETYVAGWERDFARHLEARVSDKHPIEWWMTGGRAVYTVRMLDKFQSAVVDGDLVHDGSSVLRRHVLAARMVASRVGVQIAKETPTSDRKIDAAVAAALAWQARLAAVAAGVGAPKKKSFVPARIR